MKRKKWLMVIATALALLILPGPEDLVILPFLSGILGIKVYIALALVALALLWYYGEKR